MTTVTKSEVAADWETAVASLAKSHGILKIRKQTSALEGCNAFVKFGEFDRLGRCRRICYSLFRGDRSGDLLIGHRIAPLYASAFPQSIFA
jgi:hypothetical protein